MIRPKLPKNCVICNKRLNSENRASTLGFGIGGAFDDMCMSCYDYSGWENTHSDNDHETEGNFDQDCPICAGIAIKEHVSDASKAHAPQTHSSHAECEHESTKAARAKCRRQRNA